MSSRESIEVNVQQQTLTPRYAQAVEYASVIHATQTRKGTGIAYIPPTMSEPLLSPSLTKLTMLAPWSPIYMEEERPACAGSAAPRAKSSSTTQSA